MFELVKNSLRAVHDRFEDSDHEAPPIRLVVAEGEEDITIKVGSLGASWRTAGAQLGWQWVLKSIEVPWHWMRAAA